MHGRGIHKMHGFHLLHVFRLAQQRQVFGHKLDCRIVPVVAMRMRYQHQLHAIQYLFDGKRQQRARGFGLGCGEFCIAAMVPASLSMGSTMIFVPA